MSSILQSHQISEPVWPQDVQGLLQSDPPRATVTCNRTFAAIAKPATT